MEGVVVVTTLFHRIAVPLYEQHEKLNRRCRAHGQYQRLNRIQNVTESFANLLILIGSMARMRASQRLDAFLQRSRCLGEIVADDEGPNLLPDRTDIEGQ